MSLQLWLPLNGNLNNNGLSGISVEGSPSSWSTDGKLGKCATFNGNTSYILYNSTTSFNYTDNFSFCMWLNHKYNSSGELIDTKVRFIEYSIESNIKVNTLRYYINTGKLAPDGYYYWQGSGFEINKKPGKPIRLKKLI